MRRLGGVGVGGRNPVRVMGIINASPESFLRSSVRITRRAIAAAASRMEKEGADIIDVGAASSAPYKGTAIPEAEERRRAVAAVGAVAESTDLPVSIDTCRAGVAEAAIGAGASIVNDVTGMRHDPDMGRLVSQYRPSLVLCAHSSRRLGAGEPVAQAASLLRGSLRIAAACGVPESRIVLDPAIGFFRRSGRGRLATRADADWALRDLQILGGLGRLRAELGGELLVSVSNKSFLGRIMGGAPPARRLAGSLAAELAAAIGGAGIIRTHNVADTRRALEALPS